MSRYLVIMRSRWALAFDEPRLHVEFTTTRVQYSTSIFSPAYSNKVLQDTGSSYARRKCVLHKHSDGISDSCHVWFKYTLGDI